MIEDENSFFNEDIDAASGYRNSGDLVVWDFLQYKGNHIYNPFSQALPKVLLQNKSVGIYTIKYNTAMISTYNPG